VKIELHTSDATETSVDVFVIDYLNKVTLKFLEKLSSSIMLSLRNAPMVNNDSMIRNKKN
jgi:hypothetical protein